MCGVGSITRGVRRLRMTAETSVAACNMAACSASSCSSSCGRDESSSGAISHGASASLSSSVSLAVASSSSGGAPGPGSVVVQHYCSSCMMDGVTEDLYAHVAAEHPFSHGIVPTSAAG